MTCFVDASNEVTTILLVMSENGLSELLLILWNDGVWNKVESGIPIIIHGYSDFTSGIARAWDASSVI